MKLIVNAISALAGFYMALALTMTTSVANAVRGIVATVLIVLVSVELFTLFEAWNNIDHDLTVRIFTAFYASVFASIFLFAATLLFARNIDDAHDAALANAAS